MDRMCQHAAWFSGVLLVRMTACIPIHRISGFEFYTPITRGSELWETEQCGTPAAHQGALPTGAQAVARRQDNSAVHIRPDGRQGARWATAIVADTLVSGPEA